MRFAGELLSLALETSYEVILSPNVILVFFYIGLVNNVTIDVAGLFHLTCFFDHVINELGAIKIPREGSSFSEFRCNRLN